MATACDPVSRYCKTFAACYAWVSTWEDWDASDVAPLALEVFLVQEGLRPACRANWKGSRLGTAELDAAGRALSLRAVAIQPAGPVFFLGRDATWQPPCDTAPAPLGHDATRQPPCDAAPAPPDEQVGELLGHLCPEGAVSADDKTLTWVCGSGSADIALWSEPIAADADYGCIGPRLLRYRRALAPLGYTTHVQIG